MSSTGDMVTLETAVTCCRTFLLAGTADPSSGDQPVCKCIASFSRGLLATSREKVLYDE